MKKADITAIVAEKMEISKKSATEIVDVVIDTMKNGLINDRELDIFGFVKMSVVPKPEQVKRYTMGEHKGEEYTIPAHYAPKAKFSKVVKEAVYDY